MEELPAGQNSVSVEGRFLTRAEFRRLSDVPPEAEWFANIDNANTRQAYHEKRATESYRSIIRDITPVQSWHERGLHTDAVERYTGVIEGWRIIG